MRLAIRCTRPIAAPVVDLKVPHHGMGLPRFQNLGLERHGDWVGIGQAEHLRYVVAVDGAQNNADPYDD